MFCPGKEVGHVTGPLLQYVLPWQGGRSCYWALTIILKAILKNGQIYGFLKRIHVVLYVSLWLGYRGTVSLWLGYRGTVSLCLGYRGTVSLWLGYRGTVSLWLGYRGTVSLWLVLFPR